MPHIALSLLAILTLLPAAAGAQTAASDVTFDDTSTTYVNGTDVQAALESTDAALEGFHSGLDAAASTIYLRGDCTGLRNCFTNMFLASVYLSFTRSPLPSASDRVLLDIGPGQFSPYFCTDGGATPNGYVTVRGAGPGTTELYQPTGFVGLQEWFAGISVDSCVELGFESLTVRSEAIGVLWNGPGSSRWSNIEVIAGGEGVYTAGWLEGTDGTATTCQPSTHYWFGSKLKATGGILTNTGYYVNIECSEHWFYGGEIEAEMSVVSGTPSNNRGIQLNAGEFRAFGTAVRSHLGTYTGAITSGVVGVGLGALGPGGSFHMHGGIINANSVGATVPVDAIGILANGLAHTPDTAFVVKVGTAGGTASRLIGTAENVQSPFLWPAATTTPIDVSIDGQDQFVETDCGPDGECDDGGAETHLMVYNGGLCGVDPWFDIVTGRCRNVVLP